MKIYKLLKVTMISKIGVVKSERQSEFSSYVLDIKLVITILIDAI